MGVGAGPDLRSHARRHWGWGMTPLLSSTPLVFLFPGVSPPVSVSLSHLLGRLGSGCPGAVQSQGIY